MEHEVRHAEFQYWCAAVLRKSHLRQAARLEDVPMEDRSVATMDQVAHHTAEARAQERVMHEAIRRAQALEAQAILAMEERHDDDE